MLGRALDAEKMSDKYHSRECKQGVQPLYFVALLILVVVGCIAVGWYVHTVDLMGPGAEQSIVKRVFATLGLFLFAWLLIWLPAAWLYRKTKT